MKEKLKEEKAKRSFKEHLKKLGSGIMPTLSKLSKAFLLPIALLPIAGIFLGVGATIANLCIYNGDLNAVNDYVIINNNNIIDGYQGLYFFGKVLNTMGDVAFGNLPVLFCISVAIAYTNDSGVAAITSVVGFLAFNGLQSALLMERESGFDMLWYTNVSKNLITPNLGIQSLNTGVFAAIFVGAISAWMYNRFHKTQLPSAISFFSGSKLVPIITFVAVIPLAFLFLIVWPPIGKGLAWFGENSGKLPMGTDSWIYEIFERSLVPFGLHHVFYAPLWWSAAGGDLEQLLADNSTYDLGTRTAGELLEYLKTNNIPIPKGDQTMMYWVIGHQDLINFTQISEMGLNLGRFQSGKFPFMMFGLPMAALAMWLNVPKDNRKKVMGIYFSAAFTCFLTGITEPIEFTFLFLAPWLFYLVHMPLASISFLLTGLMKTHTSMTVSGGVIDYIVFGLIPFKAGTNPLHILWIGAIMGPAYFFSFYFAVKYGKVMVPGRDGSNLSTLFTKKDFKEKKASGGKTAAQAEKASKILNFLGGWENIESVDSCASRLRVTVKDSSVVSAEGIKSLGGCNGVIVKGKSVQAVYGGEQEVIKPYLKELIEVERNKIKNKE
ncbi:PTS system, glucose-specific IIBC component [Spiroplasma corruscae]|uniref:PTS system, glucose-specific IIBC component n=1 Tax=Spiroplasma corruscae TaxID=216934 RepID=A0A222EMX2_9MOLU|nr:PTS transporter subunit EIIC [Spiroplasma corruscae]ASP27856.1 PTS system, glucose-specific IIBC component [Spiroplasma corruscae]